MFTDNIYGHNTHWGSLNFVDALLEEKYRKEYLGQSKTQFRHSVMLAIVMFLGFSPFDYFIFGQGVINEGVIAAWIARIIASCIFAVLYVLSERMDIRYLPFIIFLGWFTAFVSLWIIAAQEYYLNTTIYFYSFALLSLASTVYLPFIFLHSALTQLPIFLPIIHAVFVRNGDDTSIISTYIYPCMVLSSVSFMGLYSKYYYELTMRKLFIQNMELIDAKERADKASTVKSEFLATVSHELRTPLNGILGNLKLIRLKKLSKAQIHEKLAVVERSGLAVINLINDVLDVTRLESGTDLPVYKPFKLSTVLSDLNATLGVLADEKGLRFELPDVSDNDVTLDGDAGRLRQILLNVLGNAVKFTRKGSVTLDYTSRQDQIEFIVEDTGVGIPDDQIEDIISPFSQASNISNTEFGGSGLGLSIVKRMLDTLDGKLNITSVLDRGTTIKITLPFTTIDEFNKTDEITPWADTVGRSLQVMVVEDDPTSLMVLSELLGFDGHHVVAATNGTEAIAMFETHRVDCILTDIRLPDISGIDLVHKFKQICNREPTRQMPPILAITANVMPEDLAHYKEQGLNAVISKPVDERTLFGLLKIHTDENPRHSSHNSRQIQKLREAVGDEEFRKIQITFNTTLKESLAELSGASKHNDLEKISYLAHRIAGSAASFGHEILAEAAKTVETEIRTENSVSDHNIKELSKAGENLLKEPGNSGQ